MLLLLAFSCADAQTWQWAKRGGGPYDGTNVDPTEKTVDMATDRNGNIYALGILSTPGTPDVDGHGVSGYGDKDIILTSFTCNGVYRWSKLIGTSTWDVPSAVGTDTLGHVYISGATGAGAVHFSGDSTNIYNQKTIFLAQYDTAGTFKWLRQPGPDTATILSQGYNSPMDMVVTGNGDVYWYAVLTPGLVSGGNGWVVTDTNGYMLRYNAAGTMTAHTTLDMKVDMAPYFYNFHFNRMPGGRFIVVGERPAAYFPGVFRIGGQLVLKSLFMAAFSPTGQLLWKKTATNYGGISSRPVIDAQGGIYLSGGAYPGDTVNGHIITNPIFPAWSGKLAFITKIDSLGNPAWTRNASGLNGNVMWTGLALKGSNELWLAGTGASAWWDSAYKVQGQSNGGNFIWACRVHAANGSVLSMDSLKGSFGSEIWAHTSTADRKGNLYIGGEMLADMLINGQTLSKAGGYSDFFVTKMGNANCGCTVPTAAFSKSIAGRTVTLTYSGTTTSVDSVVWNYGNGVTVKKTGTAMSTPFTYTYPSNGTYNLCATVYSSCGTDQSCQSVTATATGIANTVFENLQVYPNPAGEQLFIEGAGEGLHATVVNLLGQQLLKQDVSGSVQAVALAGLSSGTYLLVLTSKNGDKATIRVVKQ